VMLHEALHLLDLNVPIPTNPPGPAMGCNGGPEVPDPCTEPWCNDHSGEGLVDAEFPAGYGDVHYPCLMWTPVDANNLSRLIRYQTSVDVLDPSSGQLPFDAAKHALRNHVDLK